MPFLNELSVLLHNQRNVRLTINVRLPLFTTLGHPLGIFTIPLISSPYTSEPYPLYDLRLHQSHSSSLTHFFRSYSVYSHTIISSTLLSTPPHQRPHQHDRHYRSYVLSVISGYLVYLVITFCIPLVEYKPEDGLFCSFRGIVTE